MAKYKKVKRYRRSFYSTGAKVRKTISIIVLVLVVLVAAWFAAPHVINWATHTWYTVVKNRDLEAESAAASSKAAASAAAESEAAASKAAAEKAESEAAAASKQAANAGVGTIGNWAYVDISSLTDKAAITAVAKQLAEQDITYAVVTLKDSTGAVYYASDVANTEGSISDTVVDPALVASVFTQSGITPVAEITAFRDPMAARTNHDLAIRYKNEEYLWLDNKASAGGNPWLNPYSDAAVNFIGDLIDEVYSMGFKNVVLSGVQFPSSTSSKQDYGTTNGASRSEQLTADIAAWSKHLEGKGILWFKYTLEQCIDGSTTTGSVPAYSLGMTSLLVETPSKSGYTDEEWADISATLSQNGISNIALCDESGSFFQTVSVGK